MSKLTTPTLFEFGKEILERQIDYVPLGKMHEVIAYYFEKAIRREIRRLHISTPPQHAKSTWCSIACAYAYGLDPYYSVIRASHAEKLSLRDSRITRHLVQGDVFRKYFGVYNFAEGQASDHRWGFAWPGGSGRPNFIAASVGSPAVGETASGAAIADDLLVGAEDADSLPARDAAWNCLTSGLMTRLTKDGVLIPIGTRWSEDDAPGRLIALYEMNHKTMTPPLTIVNIRWDGHYEVSTYEAD